MLDIYGNLTEEQRQQFDSMPDERRSLIIELLKMLDELGLVDHTNEENKQ